MVIQHTQTQEEVKKATISKLALSGLRPSQIAEATGYTIATVEKHLEDINARISFEMIEISELIQARNLARLEEMLSSVWGLATGTYVNDEGINITQGMPDKEFAKLALQIIKLENDQAAQVQASYQKQKEEEINLENIVVSERTFTGTNSELYQTALKALQDEYFDGETTQNFPLNKLYEQDENISVADTRILELEEKIPGLHDNRDEDDGNDGNDGNDGTEV